MVAVVSSTLADTSLKRCGSSSQAGLGTLAPKTAGQSGSIRISWVEVAALAQLYVPSSANSMART